MPTILVTGANRGIGFALAEAYVKKGWRVLATRRSSDVSLPTGVEPLILDITDADSIRALANTLADTAIDILWNNAGVYLDKHVPLHRLSNENWLRTFEINTIAPIRIAETLAHNVALSERKVVVFTSSMMGSLAVNGQGAYAYRSSKTALNMAVRCFSHDYLAQGISCVLLHPGHVKTDMGGVEGMIDEATSVAGMQAVVEPINPSTQQRYTGQFFNYDGSPITW